MTSAADRVPPRRRKIWYVGFACLRELRLIRRDRRIEVELAAIYEHICRQRYDPLRGGEDRLERLVIAMARSIATAARNT